MFQVLSIHASLHVSLHVCDGYSGLRIKCRTGYNKPRRIIVIYRERKIQHFHARYGVDDPGRAENDTELCS